jgi:hypothetical protein
MTDPILRRVLIVPDAHFPHVDRRAWNLMVKVGRALQPHEVVVLGDLVDCSTVSSYQRSPLDVSQLEVEIAAANGGLNQLDTLTGSKHFLAGNHEQRLDDYLCRKAPELFSMMKIEKLLRLEQRGWSYTPYRSFMKIGKLHFTHDTGNAGAQAHVKALASFEGSVAIGHTHRLAIHYAGSAKGSSHVGGMFGWLGDITKITYAHKIQAMRDWQTGFGVGFMEPNGNVHLQAIPIVEGKCVVNGKLYRA